MSMALLSVVATAGLPALAGAALAGAPGVLIGQALGGVLFALIAWWLARKVMDNLSGAGQPDAFAAQQDMHALSGRRGW